MKQNILASINAAIKLEYALSKLYEYFAERFPEAGDFWSKLHIEEIKHASILKTLKELSAVNLVTEDIVMQDLSEYEKTIRTIENSMNSEIIPNLNAAFEFAYSLEKTSGEIHFQEVLTKEDPDEITKVFRRLNGMDIDHASRILEYWKATVMEQ